MTDQSNIVRVRMAPGPTGPFHIGRCRTAVLNWLFARHHGGAFVLRIEDTDQERSRPEHLTGILESLRWLGLDWDEGPEVGGPYEPYYQMGRLNTYAQYAQRLEASGHAYRCYCTPEELEALRRQAEADRRPFRYPRTCRYLTPDERRAREGAGLSHVLRLAMPESGETSFDDLVLGEIAVQNAELDDWIIVRSDGTPTYNFVVVIDDVSMHITHVIRGQDHVPNTPKQIWVYRYLGETLPLFGHAPLVVGLEGKKIGARHGAEPVSAYGRDGYLPQAIVNYLATVGAAYEDEREIFSIDELIEAFDLGKLGRSSTSFDQEKLDWMNGVHIRALPLAEFVQRSIPFLEIAGLVSTPARREEIEYAAAALALEQERVRTLGETPEAVEFFFRDRLVYDPQFLVGKKSSAGEADRILRAALALVEDVPIFARDELEVRFRGLADELALKTGTVFGTIRVAITGRTAAPPLFDTMQALGRDRVRARLAAALDLLSHASVAG